MSGAVVKEEKKAVGPMKIKENIALVEKQIAAVLPAHVPIERFVRNVLLAVAQNPKLETCDRTSFFQAVVKAAELGLAPNTSLGECYLIPFYDSRTKRMMVQMIPGYRGFITLARRSGEIAKIEAHVVYEDDVFELTRGPDGVFKHTPNLETEAEGRRRFVYAFAVFKDGTSQIEVVPRWKVEKIKADSLSKIREDWQKAASPWVKHEGEMWRKTAVRALFKYLPVSTEDIRRALDADNEAARERGEVPDFAEFSVEGEAVEERAQIARPDATAKLTAALAGGDPTPEEQQAIRDQFEEEARDAR